MVGIVGCTGQVTRRDLIRVLDTVSEHGPEASCGAV